MTSTAPNTPETTRPALGELLVDSGLLSQADLDAVLVKQRETGLPLGRMLVDEGYVPAHSIAMALAEQHGGLLKTEYGFATGRTRAQSALRTTNAPTEAAEVAEERAVVGGDDSAAQSDESAARHLALEVAHRQVVAELAAERQRLAEFEARAGAQEQAIAAVQHELEQATTALQAERASRAQVDARDRAAATDRKQDVADVASARQQVVELERQAVVSEQAMAILQDELQRARAELQAGRGRRDGADTRERSAQAERDRALADLATERQRVGELEQQAAASAQLLAVVKQEFQRATTELEAERAQRAAAEAVDRSGATAAHDESLAQLASERQRVTALEQQAATGAEVLEAAQQALQDVSAELENANARRPAAGGRVYSGKRHTLFIPDPGGYLVVDRTGPAPEVGAEVGMPGDTRYRVVRIGPPSMLGDPHPQVYLEEIGTPWSA